VAEAQNTERFASFEERRMWRLLLARLHPDAGGDGDVFAFACAVREEVRGGEHPAHGPAPHGDRAARAPTAPFLHSWRRTMVNWASCNRDTLKRS
jgi:hypothetical protein